MFARTMRQRIDSLLDRVLPRDDNQEVLTLRRELEELKTQVRSIQDKGGNGSAASSVVAQPGTEDCALREVAVLGQEIEILRNEMLENIAALNRLEILTLSQRIDLLNDFGKTLPPMAPGRTRRSSKPKGFSFGIITNGQRVEKLARLIESIKRQTVTDDHYEILIAGNVNDFASRDDLRTFSMEDVASEGRLGAMRNVLAKAAGYNKFVCLDDDFLLHSSWAKAVEEVQGDFDVATGIIVNPDLSRYCDWVNIIENYTFLRSYQETFATCQYVTGGYGIYKDFIFEEHSWRDDLGFYQGEDVSFSRKLFAAGFKLKFIPTAIVMHDDERYRQKGYGVVRLKSAAESIDPSTITLKMERLCPRTLS
jgi:hypothetical protein